MKQVQRNLEIFTRDFAKQPKPGTWEILSNEPDCGGGESIAKWLSAALSIILTAGVFALAIFGG